MCKAPQVENVHYDISVPVVDCEQLNMLLGIEEGEESVKSLATELFAIYRAESDEKLAELDAICRARDSGALRKLVHFIAGSAGNLGMMRLHEICRGIERAIDAGELKDFEACAKLIPSEFELGCQRFTQTLDLDLSA